MFWFGFLGNTHIPHRKNTAGMAAEKIAPPGEVLLPMSQHIGAPATPIVKVGDEVKVGQKIAEASGYVSSPIYASVSGKVSKIESYLRPDGRTVPAIRIVSDGEMTLSDDITPPEVNDLESLVRAVRESGLVGLGGAGFPTAVKLEGVKKAKIDTVIINGAECEPYITSDTRTMLEESDLIKEGIDTLKKYLPDVRSFIFGIEKNKPECIKKLKELFALDEAVRVATLPSLYPQGGEKVIIYNTTMRVVPEGKLPSDVGCIVMNVTSLAFMAKYLKTGECEPYITSDTRTMLEESDLIKEGIDTLKKYLPDVRSFIFGIEKNKPECIKKLKELFALDEAVRVATLPSLYPQGGEKVIIYNTTMRVVPEGKLPSDVGCIVMNVTSLAFMAKYLKTGIPLVERSITVDGSAIKNPKNLVAPIGTPIRALIEAVGGLTEEGGKVIFGGPMMGQAACSLDEPITKTTGAITALSIKESTEPPVTDCIHCGRCVEACPVFLNPTVFSHALGLEGKDERVARLEEAKLGLCMECGCCSYVCPANRPLVQNNRIGKAEIREYKAHLIELAKAKEGR